MSLQVGEASPPHREQPVAEFHDIHGGFVDIPAELFRQDGAIMIATYGRTGGIQWECPVADFVEAIPQGSEILTRTT